MKTTGLLRLQQRRGQERRIGIYHWVPGFQEPVQSNAGQRTEPRHNHIGPVGSDSPKAITYNSTLKNNALNAVILNNLLTIRPYK